MTGSADGDARDDDRDPDPYSSLGHQIRSAELATGVADLRDSGVDRACHGNVGVEAAEFQDPSNGGSVGHDNAQLLPPLSEPAGQLVEHSDTRAVNMSHFRQVDHQTDGVIAHPIKHLAVQPRRVTQVDVIDQVADFDT